MRAVVVYESMFGCTRAVAEAVAAGLGPHLGATVVRAADVTPGQVAAADLVVVGAPTHAHGLPRASTRRGAPGYVAKAHGALALEPGADTAPGVREWLSSLGSLRCRAAAFDTRVRGPGLLTGRASRPIARALRHHGATVVGAPRSFLTSSNSLVEGELGRAEAWGGELAARLDTGALH